MSRRTQQRRKDELKTVPRLTVKVPTCPSHLDSVAKQEWKRITKLLKNMNVITEIDRAGLAAYCSAYSTFVAAQKQLNKEKELLSLTSNGNLVQNPLIGIRNRALEILRQFLIQYGLTPASRTEIRSLSKNMDEDPFKEYFK